MVVGIQPLHGCAWRGESLYSTSIIKNPQRLAALQPLCRDHMIGSLRKAVLTAYATMVLQQLIDCKTQNAQVLHHPYTPPQPLNISALLSLCRFTLMLSGMPLINVTCYTVVV